MNYAQFETMGTFAPEHLIAGNAKLLDGRQFTIALGQVLPAGSLLGKITEVGALTNQCVLSTATATDGSQAPIGILAQAVDTTNIPTSAMVYVRGDFRTDAVSFGIGHTAATLMDSLREIGIILI